MVEADCECLEEHGTPTSTLDLNDHDAVMEHLEWLHNQWCRTTKERNYARAEAWRTHEAALTLKTRVKELDEHLTSVVEDHDTLEDEVSLLRKTLAAAEVHVAELEDEVGLLRKTLASEDYLTVVEALADLGCRRYQSHLYSYTCRTRGDILREHWCLPCTARALDKKDEDART